MDSFIECDEIVKLYKKTGVSVMALSGLEFTVKKGEFIAVIGKSGSGKSTLLDIIAGFTRPTTGRISVAGIDLNTLSESRLLEYRGSHLGIIRQNSAKNLINYLSVGQNLETILRLRGLNKKEARTRALELLEMVGMQHKIDEMPQALSGGECQRVAIAIALSNEAELVLADEPTGALDSQSADEIVSLLRDINKKKNTTIVMVTHDLRLANKVDRVVRISDGKISSEKLIREKYLMHNRIDDFEEFYEVEYSVLDKSGRVKLNEELLAKAGINSNRVKVIAKSGKVIITPENTQNDKGGK